MDSVIESRDKIPEAVVAKTTKISRILLIQPIVKVSTRSIRCYKRGRCYCYWTWKLIYTNVIPNLLVKGALQKQLKESKAFKSICK